MCPASVFCTRWGLCGYLCRHHFFLALLLKSNGGPSRAIGRCHWMDGRNKSSCIDVQILMGGGGGCHRHRWAAGQHKQRTKVSGLNVPRLVVCVCFHHGDVTIARTGTTTARTRSWRPRTSSTRTSCRRATSTRSPTTSPRWRARPRPRSGKRSGGDRDGVELGGVELGGGE